MTVIVIVIVSIVIMDGCRFARRLVSRFRGHRVLMSGIWFRAT